MEEPRRSINVELAVRPLRLAFLVDPTDVGSVRRAVGCASGQWAGWANPLIPVYGRRPSWWRGQIVRTGAQLSAAEIAEAEIIAWDPDFVVECRDSPAGDLAPRLPRLTVDELSNHHFGEEERAAGVSISLLVERLHEELYRFRRAGGADPVVVEGAGAHADLAAVLFGCFSGPQAEPLEEHYRELMGATDLLLGPENLLGLLGHGAPPGWLTPIAVGSHKISVYWPFEARSPTIFAFSAASAIDLIDLWNLRAQGKQLIPLPIEMRNDLIPQVRQLIEDRDGERPVGLAGGRRVVRSDLEELRAQLDPDRSIVIEPGLLRFDHELEGHGFERPGIVAIEEEHSVALEGGRLRLPLPRPRLTRRGTAPNLNAWASVVRFRGTLDSHDLACTFDPQLGEMAKVLDSWQPHSVMAREEGLVSILGVEDEINWRPPAGVDLFSHLARESGFEPELSEPGSIALEMVRRLGGIEMLALVRDAAVVELLHAASKREEGTASLGEVREAMMRSRGGERRRADQLLRGLLERRVLDLGLKLRCPRCRKVNWYSPDELGSECECRRCLGHFPFPGVHPPRDWAYRPRGGFAAPGFAGGSYPVLFSLAVLSELAGRTTLSPSLRLGSDLEVDFAVWGESESFMGPRRWDLLLGEAKSNTEFKDDDIARAAKLRRFFPGAKLVFSTLRPKLTEHERSLISILARPSKPASAPPYADVIVLTALELYARHGLGNAWEAAGMSGAGPPRSAGDGSPFAQLADTTQQLHLGLTPYADYRWARP